MSRMLGTAVAARSGRVRDGVGNRPGGDLLGGDPLGEEVQVERGPLGPAQFWRGQSRYEVGEVLDSWRETPPWWLRQTPVSGGAVSGGAVSGGAVSSGASAELISSREVWRVEAVRAGRSQLSFAGVYDLSWDAAGNRWWLVRVHD